MNSQDVQVEHVGVQREETPLDEASEAVKRKQFDPPPEEPTDEPEEQGQRADQVVDAYRDLVDKPLL